MDDSLIDPASAVAEGSALMVWVTASGGPQVRRVSGPQAGSLRTASGRPRDSLGTAAALGL